MASINKVLLMGRLGADPELRYTTEGTPVATFRMATSESYKDRAGVKQERTEWHSIVAWRKLAEIAGDFLKKGRLVFVEGKIQSREWEKDGEKRKVFEIVASNLQLLPSGQGQGQGNKEKRGSAAPGGSIEDDFIPEFDDDVPI